MRTKQIVLTIVIIIIAVTAQGCAVAFVGAGAGTVAYLKGSLKAVLDSDLDNAFNASLKALEALEIAPTKKEKDALSAVIKAETAKEKNITIKLKAAENNLTELSIKIGAFGDRTQSQLIYDEIRKHL